MAGIALAAKQIIVPLQKGKVAIIADTFTAAAYGHGAFYDYYCSHKAQDNSSNNNNSDVSSIPSNV